MWVFGYGSLVWNPGFAPAESAIARLRGYRRSFCMRSVHHRGTPDAPGLVLALDEEPQAECLGLAMRAPEGREDAVLTDLRERELVSSAYHERRLEAELADGRRVEALAFVVDRDHVQYCGGLGLEEQARVIAHARGGRGANAEYLLSTVEGLRGLGIGDPDLDLLARRVRRMQDGSAKGAGPPGTAPLENRPDSV